MDETTIVNGTEQAADQTDSFLEGWDDDAVTVEPVDQPDETQEPQQAEAAETAPESETADAEAEAQPETDAAEAEAKPEETATWHIKHLDEERTLGVADITPELLQKGMDYDRIRGKYDEAKPVMELFSELAKKANMNVADYAKMIRAEAKKAEGLSEAEARRVVELEDREAAVAALEAAKREAETKKAADAAKVKADLDEFKAAFPEVYRQAKDSPTAIPKAVWDEVNAGKMSLTAAYSKWAVAQARAEAKAAQDHAQTAERNATNASRSTGSMKSAGSDTGGRDPFLMGFDEQ